MTGVDKVVSEVRLSVVVAYPLCCTTALPAGIAKKNVGKASTSGVCMKKKEKEKEKNGWGREKEVQMVSFSKVFVRMAK